MQRHKDLIQESRNIRKKACLLTSSTSSQVRYYRYKRGIVVGTTRGRVRSRSSMQVSARKLAANFWKMNEIPLAEVMEEKKFLQRGENLSTVLSASVSHLSDHAPRGSVSQRMDEFISSCHQRTPSVSLEDKHSGPTVRAVDQHSSASLMETEISYKASTPREPIVGVRTRLKDVNNALVTSKELLKIIDRILAHNDQRASSMSLVAALHSELERACLQVNQLIKEQISGQGEMSYLVKCFVEERASYDKKQQAVEVAIESIAGELKAERKTRCQYEILNNKLGRQLNETEIAFTNTTKELESEKKARQKMEQVCHELASDIGQKEFERDRKILQLSRKLGGKKVQTKLSEYKGHVDEKNGVVEKLMNQLEAFFKSKKSEKTSCDRITTCSSRTHVRSDKNEEKDYGGEVGESSAESDLHSIELNMDNRRGSFKWGHASTAARDILSTDDEMIAKKYISGVVPRSSSYTQGNISDGFQRGIHTRTTPSSVNFLQQERFYGFDKKSQRKGDKCKLPRHESVKDLMDKILSSSSLESGVEYTSPIQEWAHPLHSQCFGHGVEERTCSMQRLSTKSRLGATGGAGQKQRRIRR